jgi:hypothetical protein
MDSHPKPIAPIHKSPFLIPTQRPHASPATAIVCARLPAQSDRLSRSNPTHNPSCSTLPVSLLASAFFWTGFLHSRASLRMILLCVPATFVTLQGSPLPNALAGPTLAEAEGSLTCAFFFTFSY